MSILSVDESQVKASVKPLLLDQVQLTSHGDISGQNDVNVLYQHSASFQILTVIIFLIFIYTISFGWLCEQLCSPHNNGRHASRELTRRKLK